jgi:hypothetical protein
MSSTDAIAELRASIAAMTERLNLLTAVPPSVASGTKLRWSLDENNRRIAIALKDGAILQVKIVENGSHVWTTDPRIRQKFATYADWIATLPPGGTVVTVEPDTRNSVEKRLATNLEGLTDAQKVRKLMETWGAKAYVWEDMSPLEKITDLTQWLQQRRRDLAAITEEEDIADPRIRRKLTSKLANLSLKLKLQRQRVSTMTEQQKNTRFAWVSQWGATKLFARVDGDLQMITERNGKILIGNRWVDTFGFSAASLKPDGRPMLWVRYRKQMIEL